MNVWIIIASAFCIGFLAVPIKVGLRKIRSSKIDRRKTYLNPPEGLKPAIEENLAEKSRLAKEEQNKQSRSHLVECIQSLTFKDLSNRRTDESFYYPPDELVWFKPEQKEGVSFRILPRFPKSTDDYGKCDPPICVARAQHYLGHNNVVQCIGEDCPICKCRSKQIVRIDKDGYGLEDSYAMDFVTKILKRTQRYYYNIYIPSEDRIALWSCGCSVQEKMQRAIHDSSIADPATGRTIRIVREEVRNSSGFKRHRVVVDQTPTPVHTSLDKATYILAMRWNLNKVMESRECSKEHIQACLDKAIKKANIVFMKEEPEKIYSDYDFLRELDDLSGKPREVVDEFEKAAKKIHESIRKTTVTKPPERPHDPLTDRPVDLVTKPDVQWRPIEGTSVTKSDTKKVLISFNIGERLQQSLLEYSLKSRLGTSSSLEHILEEYFHGRYRNTKGKRICHNCEKEMCPGCGEFCCNTCEIEYFKSMLQKAIDRSTDRAQADRENPPTGKCAQCLKLTYSDYKFCTTICRKIYRGYNKHFKEPDCKVKTCKRCGGKFRPSNHHLHNYCSAECAESYDMLQKVTDPSTNRAQADREKPPTGKCTHCGKTLSAEAAIGGRDVFCSAECINAYKSTSHLIKPEAKSCCNYCGNIFVEKNEWTTPLKSFCSVSCKENGIRFFGRKVCGLSRPTTQPVCVYCGSNIAEARSRYVNCCLSSGCIDKLHQEEKKQPKEYKCEQCGIVYDLSAEKYTLPYAYRSTIYCSQKCCPNMSMHY